MGKRELLLLAGGGNHPRRRLLAPILALVLAASFQILLPYPASANQLIEPPVCNPSPTTYFSMNLEVCAVSTTQGRDFVCWYDGEDNDIKTVEVLSANSRWGGFAYRRNVEAVCDDYPGGGISNDVNVVFWLSGLEDDLVFRSTPLSGCSCSCPTGTGGIPTEAGSLTSYQNHNGTFPQGLGGNPALWGQQIKVEVNGRESHDTVWLPTANDPAKHPNLVFWGGYNMGIAGFGEGVGDVNTGVDAVKGFGRYQFYFAGGDGNDIGVDLANGFLDFEGYLMGEGADIVWDGDCDFAAAALGYNLGDVTNCPDQASGEIPQGSFCVGVQCGIGNYLDCPYWASGSGLPGPT